MKRFHHGLPLVEKTHKTSQQRMAQIISRMAQAEGIDDKLKATDQMAWMGRMNNIRHRAEAIILQEPIYG